MLLSKKINLYKNQIKAIKIKKEVNMYRVYDNTFKFTK